mgnify:CR=1 FL=1
MTIFCSECGTEGNFDGKDWKGIAERVLDELKRLTSLSAYPIYKDDIIRIEAHTRTLGY